MNELKNSKFKKDNLNNIFVTIDDEERLHRIERNLHLAYLYKIKESIIQKKIVNDSINSYLDGIVFGDEILTDEDKEVILDYARKSKTLKK